MRQLYTIGHSTCPTEQFLELLRLFGVQYVLDVRSVPFSRYVPQYNRDSLQAALRRENIDYFHMGKNFGARQEDPAYYSPEGFLDFERFRRSDAFLRGMKNVETGLEKYNIALMCTEKDPIDCHRAVMVARGFELDGVDVKHILHDGQLMTQEELNRRLLDRYFPDRAQMSLFTMNEDNSEEELLAEAYRRRNREIGYHPGSDREGGSAE